MLGPFCFHAMSGKVSLPGSFIKAIGTAILALGLLWILASRTWAQSEPAKPPALAFYDWSVNRAHSLASTPPPVGVVQAFTNAAFQTDYTKVCDFDSPTCATQGLFP